MNRTSTRVSAATASRLRDASYPKLLIVDDEVQIREVIGALVEDFCQPIYAASGEEAIRLAQKQAPALILLDIMMPGMDGIEVCERLRGIPSTRETPIIMLSAASQVGNRIKSFNLGADDFLPKPFDAEELISRIRTKLRRHAQATLKGRYIHCGNLCVALKENMAFIDDAPIRLSLLEFEILALMAENQGEVVSRRQILKRVWKDDADSDRLIDAHLVSLRKRISTANVEIVTFYGKGYSLREK